MPPGLAPQRPYSYLENLIAVIIITIITAICIIAKTKPYLHDFAVLIISDNITNILIPINKNIPMTIDIILSPPFFVYLFLCLYLFQSLTQKTAKKKQKIRPAKEWLIPSNPRYYDIIRAFEERDEIEWKQGAGVREGDTVFMYVGAPVSAVLYK